VLSVMVFLLHVGRLPLAISRIVSRNRILCEAAFSYKGIFQDELHSVSCLSFVAKFANA